MRRDFIHFTHAGYNLPVGAGRIQSSPAITTYALVNVEILDRHSVVMLSFSDD